MKMKKEKELTSKIRLIMDQIKNQAHLEEGHTPNKKKSKLRSYSIHPDQKNRNKNKK